MKIYITCLLNDFKTIFYVLDKRRSHVVGCHMAEEKFMFFSFCGVDDIVESDWNEII